MQVDYLLISIVQSRYRVVRWVGTGIVILVLFAVVMFSLGVVHDNAPKVGEMFGPILRLVSIPDEAWPFIGSALVLAVIFGALLLVTTQIMLRSGVLSLASGTPESAPEFKDLSSRTDQTNDGTAATGEEAPEPKKPPFPDQDFADWLTEKYEYGVHKLLNGPIDTATQFADLAKADDQWVRGIGRELLRHGASRQEWVDFNFLQEVPTEPRFHPEPIRDHLRRMINVRLNRLKKAIDRYSERPVFYSSPISDGPVRR